MHFAHYLEVVIYKAIEQICLHLTMLSAKVVNISETPKKWEDFLISEPLYNKE
jgi:hypothetical protein